MDTSISPGLRDAVDAVVDEHGWGGTTAELIASAAQVNRTTLYRHGFTRERLLVEAAVAAAADFRTATIGPLTAAGSAGQRMELLLDALYDLADDHLGLLAGLYDGPTAMFHLAIAESDAALVTRFEYTDPFERLLLDGNIDGTLHSTDPRTDAELIFNSAGWTYIHFRRSHQWESTITRAAVTRLVLGSFRVASHT